MQTRGVVYQKRDNCVSKTGDIVSKTRNVALKTIDEFSDIAMDAEQTYALLQKMSARLGYLPGMHDVCFAVAVVEQYKLAVAAGEGAEQLKLLEQTVSEKLTGKDGTGWMELRIVKDQYDLLQTFCAGKLLDYHNVEESSHIGSFVGVYMTLQEGKSYDKCDFGLFYDCFATVLRLTWVYFDAGRPRWPRRRRRSCSRGSSTLQSRRTTRL